MNTPKRLYPAELHFPLPLAILRLLNTIQSYRKCPEIARRKRFFLPIFGRLWDLCENAGKSLCSAAGRFNVPGLIVLAVEPVPVGEVVTCQVFRLEK